MNYVADNKEQFLNNFYLKSKRSVAKAHRRARRRTCCRPTTRVRRGGRLVNLLETTGLSRCIALTSDVEVKDGKFPAGSYVVRMDQPYSRMADMLLDTQYYNVNDPRPYDDTGWTLGPLDNVKTVRVKDTKILDAPMTLTEGPAKITGKIEGKGKAGYVINHTGESAVAQLRFRLRDVNISSPKPRSRSAIRVLTPVHTSSVRRQSSDLDASMAKDSMDLGLTATAVDKLPDVAQHALKVPRIALVHTWLNTQDEGWYRVEFDQLGIPYDYISDQMIGRTPDLREKWDVILFGPVRTTAQNIVRGTPKFSDSEGPIPWKKSDVTPNLGMSPDQTDDIRGGIGIQGVANLQAFIESGGLFITVGGNASLPIDFGITSGVSIQDAKLLQANGSIFNTVFADRKSPIAYGYDEKLAVYFNQAPLLQVAAIGGFGGPQPAGRPSGRGTEADADVIQGRPPVDTAAPMPTPDPAQTPPLAIRPRDRSAVRSGKGVVCQRNARRCV